jgi:pyruvate-ferredoxin/flavodoxin oxidoreductase
MKEDEGKAMRDEKTVILDGNEAAAAVAYRLAEVIAIYPITPSSTMGEWADQWKEEGRKNIWGSIPIVAELQSEGGAAGAMHGALQAGAFSTTFTASQGLLLMIPNMYKIAGELTSNVIHVTARSIATHALSIFGDHSDVMACRTTGYAMLSSNSVQEAADMALIAHVATLEARIPFLHFFDGFRTSHEINKAKSISDETILALLEEKYISGHRQRALSPDRPILRGTAQNPDVFFQAREACNSFYLACPTIVQDVMDRFAEQTGRRYHLFDYVGAPDADRVLILMGSGSGAAEETIDRLNQQGEKIGLLKVHLYRPFAADALLAALPKTVRSIAVLDRTKEPGATGEPLYQDVVTACSEAFAGGSSRFAQQPRILGGRYGLSSKEFTPAMAKGVFDELKKAHPKNHFTVGILDDVTHTSLAYDPEFSTEDPRTVRALFYGLGSDGTVGANKNSIKIIGQETSNYAQGYFVYDSKKSGSVTTSHLRFGPDPIRSSYLISKANFVACHQFSFLERVDVLEAAAPEAVFLLNAPYGPKEIWGHLPRTTQETILKKKLKFYVIDGYTVAREAHMGSRINTIMQTCFFAISGVLPKEQAIQQIKKAIQKTYGKRGDAVVQQNFAAVDAALAHLHPVEVPDKVTASFDILPIIPAAAPAFVHDVLGAIASGHGDTLPVSALPPGGTFPTGTAKWEKRNIAQMIPVWDKELCIQCGKCVLVCPHAVIRAKVYDEAMVGQAPATFKSAKPKWRGMERELYTLQVSPEDCTGCTICVEVCPVKSKSEAKHKAINMEMQAPLREAEAKNWEFFESLPSVDRSRLAHTQVKDIQLLEPLFEFSGACAGCGETPYIKLLTQLFGDRLYIANATGCSSIYGGNLPTTPYTVNKSGRGPTWSNSLFEDNAEFGLGMRLALNQQKAYAEELLVRLAPIVGDVLATAILTAKQSTELEIEAQRERVRLLREKLAVADMRNPHSLSEEELLESESMRDFIDSSDVRGLLAIADALVRKSVWMIGGDGWAYDIGYGGLDHVLSLPFDLNVLVLDTEVYSNTGGQASKATPVGAAAKFAASGKETQKKDLGLMAMSYRNAYVASVAFGSNDNHTVKALVEAESYPGPSLIVAYSHCIAHGYDLKFGLDQQRRAVDCGLWPLYRYDPRLLQEGKPPLQIDSPPTHWPVRDYLRNETRFAMVEKIDRERFARLSQASVRNTAQRLALYKELSRISLPQGNGEGSLSPVLASAAAFESGGKLQSPAPAATHEEA